MGGETEMEIYEALVDKKIYPSVKEARIVYEGMVERGVYNSMDEALDKAKEIIGSYTWFEEVDKYIL